MISFRRPLNKGLHDRDLNVLVFLCCTCVAPTQPELSEREVITFLLFLSLGHVSMKLNHKYTFKPYIMWLFFCPHLLQMENGEDDSSSESEDEQEQVGHRRKVDRAIVLPWFFKNPFQLTCFSNFIYYNVLHLICFKKVLPKRLYWLHVQICFSVHRTCSRKTRFSLIIGRVI